MDAERPFSQEPSGSGAARAGAALVRAERRHLARELHDSPVQFLSAAALRLQVAAQDESAVPGAVDAATHDLEQAMAALRAMMARLASSQVEPEVMDDALTGLDTSEPEQRWKGPVSIEDAAAYVTSAFDAAAATVSPSTG